MSNVIFIGGVHGVGKTTICNELVSTYLIPAYTASRIISEIKNENLPSDKLIPDIDVNQALLIEGLKGVKATKKTFILDGHFCLINQEGTISKISEKVFQEIKPIAFIVVTDTVNNIVERLKRRDSINYEPAFIEHFQYEEINYAFSLSNILNIPFYNHNNNLNSLTQLHNFISGLGVIK